MEKLLKLSILLSVAIFLTLYPACFENPGVKAGDESKSAGFRSETPDFSPGELHSGLGRANELEFSKVNAGYCLSPGLNISDAYLTRTITEYYQLFFPFYADNLRYCLRMLLHDLSQKVTVLNMEMSKKEGKAPVLLAKSGKLAEVFKKIKGLDKKPFVKEPVLAAFEEFKNVSAEMCKTAADMDIKKELRDKLILLNEQIQGYFQLFSAEPVILDSVFPAYELLKNCLPDFEPGLLKNPFVEIGDEEREEDLDVYTEALEMIEQKQKPAFLRACKKNPGLKKLAVKFKVNWDPFFKVKVNKALLSSVMRNLIKNCLKHLDSGDKIGEVKIEFMQKGNTAEIVFSNPGEIPAKFLEKDDLTGAQRIFLPGITSKDNSPDNGYGLYSALFIVKALGGDIRAENKDGRALFYVSINAVRQMLLEKSGGLSLESVEDSGRKSADTEYPYFSRWLERFSPSNIKELLIYSNRGLDQLQRVIELRGVYYENFGEIIRKRMKDLPDNNLEQEQQQADPQVLISSNKQLENLLLRRGKDIKGLLKQITAKLEKEAAVDPDKSNVVNELKARKWRISRPDNFVQWIVFLSDKKNTHWLNFLTGLSIVELEELAGLYDFILPICNFIIDDEFKFKDYTFTNLMLNYQSVKRIKQLREDKDFILKKLYPQFKGSRKTAIDQIIVENALKNMRRYIRSSNIFRSAFIAHSMNVSQYEQTKSAILNIVDLVNDPENYGLMNKVILEGALLSPEQIVQKTKQEVLDPFNEQYDEYGVTTEKTLRDFFYLIKPRGSEEHDPDYWPRQLISQTVQTASYIKEESFRAYLLFKTMAIMEEENNRSGFSWKLENIIAKGLYLDLFYNMKNNIRYLEYTIGKILKILNSIRNKTVDKETIKKIKEDIEIHYHLIKESEKKTATQLSALTYVQIYEEKFSVGIHPELLIKLLYLLREKPYLGEIKVEDIKKNIERLKENIEEVKFHLDNFELILNKDGYTDLTKQLRKLRRQVLVEQAI